MIYCLKVDKVFKKKNKYEIYVKFIKVHLAISDFFCICEFHLYCQNLLHNIYYCMYIVKMLIKLSTTL